jgi:ABC-type multidrug transport system fused ATPase/permease subunit
LLIYINTPDEPITKGVWLVVVYSLAILIATFFRNYYIFKGYVVAVRMRKTLVSAMYDKVGVLSMKSLTETNSGKLITIISGDIFNVERATTMTPILPAAPLVTLLCLFYIAWGSGIEFAGYTLIIWLLTILGQFCCNQINKKIKAKESILND